MKALQKKSTVLRIKNFNTLHCCGGCVDATFRVVAKPYLRTAYI